MPFPVLHPTYKMQYFINHDWEPKWVDEALHLIREEWFKYYKPEPRVKIENDADAGESNAMPQLP